MQSNRLMIWRSVPGAISRCRGIVAWQPASQCQVSWLPFDPPTGSLGSVESQSFSADTDPQIHAILVERLRAMSPSEKGQMVANSTERANPSRLPEFTSAIPTPNPKRSECDSASYASARS